MDAAKPPLKLRLEGEGVVAASGVRALDSFDGDKIVGRDVDGWDEGGRFSASDDWGDNDGVWWAVGSGETNRFDDRGVASGSFRELER